MLCTLRQGSSGATTEKALLLVEGKPALFKAESEAASCPKSIRAKGTPWSQLCSRGPESPAGVAQDLRPFLNLHPSMFAVHHFPGRNSSSISPLPTPKSKSHTDAWRGKTSHPAHRRCRLTGSERALPRAGDRPSRSSCFKQLSRKLARRA